MQLRTIWQYGNSQPDNADNFAAISQWWSGLQGKEVRWQQRLLSPSADVADLNWDPQRFDETFVITSPEVRGITLYWAKPDNAQPRNTTVQKLELDVINQALYVFPQSQPELVIRVALPQVSYQFVELRSPQVRVLTNTPTPMLILQSPVQKLEIRVQLTPEILQTLKNSLPG